tara:strand:- start:168 stop:407 length:240 start_codon:yes stop_codon:yes gene_type:complete
LPKILALAGWTCENLLAIVLSELTPPFLVGIITLDDYLGTGSSFKSLQLEYYLIIYLGHWDEILFFLSVETELYPYLPE